MKLIKGGHSENERIEISSIELSQYIADYVNEELERGNEIDSNTIMDCLEAFQGGAR